MLGLVVNLYLIVLEDISLVLVQFALVQDRLVYESQYDLILEFIEGMCYFQLLAHYKSLYYYQFSNQNHTRLRRQRAFPKEPDKIYVKYSSFGLQSIEMYSKNNQRGKIIVPEIRSRDHSKGKSIKREDPEKNHYGTDQKRQLDRSHASDLQFNDATSCAHCRARMSQFVTKKPTHPTERGTQTSHKPFLIDLIQERVENICRNNSKLNRLLEQRQQELLQKQQQISQIEDKFTGILLSLAQQVAGGRKLRGQWHELKRVLSNDSDTPAYLKALQFDC